jgi:hypothetical protein
MNSDSKKLFTTTQNFALLREKLGDYKRLPTEKEVREFLEFLADVYKIWKEKLKIIFILKRIGGLDGPY